MPAASGTPEEGLAGEQSYHYQSLMQNPRITATEAEEGTSLTAMGEKLSTLQMFQCSGSQRLKIKKNPRNVLEVECIKSNELEVFVQLSLL